MECLLILRYNLIGNPIVTNVFDFGSNIMQYFGISYIYTLVLILTMLCSRLLLIMLLILEIFIIY